MTTYKTAILAVAALMSATFLASHVAATEGIMMKDGKMTMMKDGKSTGFLTEDVTMSDGHILKPDGTMKMKDGQEMKMKEGQMMTMDGKMSEGGKSMDHKAMEGGKAMGSEKAMEGGKDMKMGGMK